MTTTRCGGQGIEAPFLGVVSPVVTTTTGSVCSVDLPLELVGTLCALTRGDRLERSNPSGSLDNCRTRNARLRSADQSFRTKALDLRIRLSLRALPPTLHRSYAQRRHPGTIEAASQKRIQQVKHVGRPLPRDAGLALPPKALGKALLESTSSLVHRYLLSSSLVAWSFSAERTQSENSISTPSRAHLARQALSHNALSSGRMRAVREEPNRTCEEPRVIFQGYNR